jgi:hypothetical protein
VVAEETETRLRHAALTIAMATWWLLTATAALAAGITPASSATTRELAPPEVVASDWIDLTLPPPTKAGPEIVLQTYLHSAVAAIPNSTMWFQVDSDPVRRAATDGGGVAQLHLRDLPAGDHTVVASYYITFEKTWVSVSGSFTVLPLFLTIRTIPAFPGVTFSLTGDTYSTTFVSDGQGMATVAIPLAGQPTLSATPPPADDSRRVTFARWSDDVLTSSRQLRIRNDVSIDYGLRISYLTRINFVAVDGKALDVGRVADVALNGPNAEVIKLQAPFAPVWLTTPLPSRPSGITGLHITPAPYSLATGTYDGLSVVNRGGLRYTPVLGGTWTIALLLYDLRIHARDAIFGTSYGNYRVAVVDPIGKKRELLLDNQGTASLTLGRGIYSVRVIAPGISPAAPVALSRSQTAVVPIISPRDIALLAGPSLALVAIMFVVARRRDWIVAAARPGEHALLRVVALASRRGHPFRTPQQPASPTEPRSYVRPRRYTKPYPPEFRADAVRLVGHDGRTISGVAKDLGVSTGSLRNWIRKADLHTGDSGGRNPSVSLRRSRTS